jgi:hypothetical protein
VRAALLPARPIRGRFAAFAYLPDVAMCELDWRGPRPRVRHTVTMDRRASDRSRRRIPHTRGAPDYRTKSLESAFAGRGFIELCAAARSSSRSRARHFDGIGASASAAATGREPRRRCAWRMIRVTTTCAAPSRLSGQPALDGGRRITGSTGRVLPHLHIRARDGARGRPGRLSAQVLERLAEYLQETRGSLRGLGPLGHTTRRCGCWRRCPKPRNVREMGT